MRETSIFLGLFNIWAEVGNAKSVIWQRISSNRSFLEHERGAPEMGPRRTAQGLRQRAGGKDYVSS